GHVVGDVHEVNFAVADDLVGDRPTAARVPDVETHDRILAQIERGGNALAGCGYWVVLAEVLVHEGDGHAPLADRGCNALDGTEPDITAGEDAGHACLEEVRVALERPRSARLGVGAGKDVALLVERDLGRQ